MLFGVEGLDEVCYRGRMRMDVRLRVVLMVC